MKTLEHANALLILYVINANKKNFYRYFDMVNILKMYGKLCVIVRYDKIFNNIAPGFCHCT